MLRVLKAVAHFIIAWRRYHRDRQLLAMLNERELRDIGLDRSLVKTDDGPEFWRWR